MRGPGWIAGVIVSVIAATGMQDPQKPPVEEDTAPFPREGRYAGKPACVSCHRSETRRIESGVHRTVISSPALMGCETCHGPGHAHAADDDNDPFLITFPPALSAPGQKRLCGRCHAPEVSGHGGDLPGFLEAGRGCTECHGVHESRPGEPRPGVRYRTRLACDAASEPAGGALCASCHPRLDARLSRSHHAALCAPCRDRWHRAPDHAAGSRGRRGRDLSAVSRGGRRHLVPLGGRARAAAVRGARLHELSSGARAGPRACARVEQADESNVRPVPCAGVRGPARHDPRRARPHRDRARPRLWILPRRGRAARGIRRLARAGRVVARSRRRDPARDVHELSRQERGAAARPRRQPPPQRRLVPHLPLAGRAAGARA